VLYVFGFKQIAVAVSDLYFMDPEPSPGQEGAEHGVRLEVRLLESGPPGGSIYASRPITIGRPVWRADFLETVDGEPGSFDRTHHHPRVRGWEPGPREFDRAVTADPLGWVGRRLDDLDSLMGDAHLPSADREDVVALRQTIPEIQATVERLLRGVRAGDLAKPPEREAGLPGARASWL
jgi:hypothetical protein